MPARNSQTHYGSVTKLFHWLTALLILTALPLGVFGSYGIDTTTEAGISQAAWVFSLHKTIGISAFLVAVLRILWALTNTKPGLLNADHKLEATAAEVVHWLLYISLVIVPLSGWLHHAAASGFAPILWPLGQSCRSFQNPPPCPNSLLAGISSSPKSSRFRSFCTLQAR